MEASEAGRKDSVAERTSSQPHMENVLSGNSDVARERFLFPIDGEHSREVLRLVCDLVMDTGAKLFLALPVIKEDENPAAMADQQQKGHRYAGRFVDEAEQYCHNEVVITKIVKIGSQRADILRDIASTHNISTLLTEGISGSRIESLLGMGEYDRAKHVGECDAIFVTRWEHRESIDSVVAPIARGPHAGLAIETGLALARQHTASLDVLHVYDPDKAGEHSSAEEVQRTASKYIDQYEAAQTVIQEASDIPRAIVEYTRPFDVTVLGAPREGLLQQFITDTIPEEVGVHSTGTVLTTRRAGAQSSWLERWI
jgi:nucleotide-binding universal stress UspA family protein